MVLLRSVLSAIAVLLVTIHQVADSAPTPSKRSFKKRGLNASAPVASDVDGAHLLLLNDVDSSTAKNAFVLLSKPRDYYTGMTACSSMGDGKSPIPRRDNVTMSIAALSFFFSLTPLADPPELFSHRIAF